MSSYEGKSFQNEKTGPDSLTDWATKKNIQLFKINIFNIIFKSHHTQNFIRMHLMSNLMDFECWKFLKKQIHVFPWYMERSWLSWLSCVGRFLKTNIYTYLGIRDVWKYVSNSNLQQTYEKTDWNYFFSNGTLLIKFKLYSS